MDDNKNGGKKRQAQWRHNKRRRVRFTLRLWLRVGGAVWCLSTMPSRQSSHLQQQLLVESLVWSDLALFWLSRELVRSSIVFFLAPSASPCFSIFASNSCSIRFKLGAALVAPGHAFCALPSVFSFSISYRTPSPITTSSFFSALSKTCQLDSTIAVNFTPLQTTLCNLLFKFVQSLNIV